ncbi:MAG: 23S rRNA (guanosine(2251)-2'-O)-methyltransferase RlmB [Caldisericia bacterium]
MEKKRQFSLEEDNVIYSKNEIFEAIEKNILLKVIFKYGYKNRFIENLLKEKNIPFTYKDHKFFKNYPESNNIVGFISPIKIKTINDLKVNSEDIYVMVLNIEDPHNFGAIIRSSEIFGVKGVLFPKRRSTTITPTVIKSSTGAIFNIDMYEFIGVNSTIKELKNKGLWIVSLDVNAKDDLSNFNPILPMVLIVGGEDRGINLKVLESSDFVIKIKTFGKTTSLNASVSCGIALYEITKIKK